MARTIERRAALSALWRGGGHVIIATLLMAAPIQAQSADTRVPPPPGFVSFCVRFPDQCETPSGEPSDVSLTDERWQALRQVNTQVNESIWPEDDETHYGRPEYWTIPTDGYGDCDDYALTKRKELIDRGFPELALRMAVVNMPTSGRHAVLVVATNKGDFVLDNLTDDVVNPQRTPYTWIEEQSADNPREWVSLQPDPHDRERVAAGSIK